MGMAGVASARGFGVQPAGGKSLDRQPKWRNCVAVQVGGSGQGPGCRAGQESGPTFGAIPADRTTESRGPLVLPAVIVLVDDTALSIGLG